MDVVIPVLVAGAAAAGGLWRLFGGRGPSGSDAPRALWLRQFPGDEVRSVVMSGDGRFALVQTGWGCGLVRIRDGNAWRLDGAEAAIVPSGLALVLPEPGACRAYLQMPRDTAELWHDRISAG